MQLIVLLAALFTLHGCGVIESADVDVKKAVLHSPEGVFEFERDKKRPLTFRAKDSPTSVVMSLFPINGKTSLRFYNKRVQIKSQKAYSQLNNDERLSLTINLGRTSHQNSIKFNVIAPPTMDYYQWDGDGLHVTKQRQPITLKHKWKAFLETYRYYIPFTIDGEDYAIDVTFKLDIDSSLSIGAPGMP